MLEVLGESFADVERDVLHLQRVDAMPEVTGEVVVHVAACTGVADASVRFLAAFDVVLHILAEPHVGKGHVVVDASLSLGDVDDALCLDGIGCIEDVTVDDFGIRGGLWNEVEMQELVGADAIRVDVKIDGEVVVGEFLESNLDGFLGVDLVDVCHSLFLPKIRIKYSIRVTNKVTK